MTPGAPREVSAVGALAFFTRRSKVVTIRDTAGVPAALPKSDPYETASPQNRLPFPGNGCVARYFVER